MHIQWHPVDSLKLVVLGTFTPQKLANASDQATNATNLFSLFSPALKKLWSS